jgi:hypothetical protein
VPLPRQPEVRDLQRLIVEVIVLYLLEQQDCRKTKGGPFHSLLIFQS